METLNTDSFSPESPSGNDDLGVLEPKKYNPALERILLAKRIIYDTIVSYDRPLSKPIKGYPQKNRAIVRKWRTRIGHAIHGFPLVTNGLGLIQYPSSLLIFDAACVLGLIYIDFINPSRNLRQFIRRVHQIYPFFPKPSAK